MGLENLSKEEIKVYYQTIMHKWSITMRVLKKIMSSLEESFSNLIESIKNILEGFNKHNIKVGIKPKQRYEPILYIKLTKPLIEDKRLNNYYCRSNL